MREKPPFTRGMLRDCVRKGYAPLSIDRELLEYLRNFVSSSIGEFMELRGFVVARGEQTFLRFGLGVSASIRLVGLDKRLVKAVVGEPVKVQGFKVGKLEFRVERISVGSIVRSRPYADYSYLKSVALDGVELETPEDAVALCLVSSPRQGFAGVAGGARQALLGKHRSYLDRRLRSLTISSRYVWKFGRVQLSRVSVVKKAFSLYAEVSADVDSDSPDKVLDVDVVDFPTIVSRAPRESLSDFDAIDYTLWVKGVRPRMEPSSVRRVLERVASELSKRVVSLGIDPRLKLFSLDYEARPSTVLRLAHAIARVRGSTDPEPFVSEALRIVEASLDALVSTLSEKPTRVIKVRDLEKAVLKILEKFEPYGATPQQVAKELSMANVREVEEVLERLRKKGLVYCPRPNTYRVTPL